MLAFLCFTCLFNKMGIMLSTCWPVAFVLLRRPRAERSLETGRLVAGVGVLLCGVILSLAASVSVLLWGEQALFWLLSQGRAGDVCGEVGTGLAPPPGAWFVWEPAPEVGSLLLACPITPRNPIS